MISIIVPVYNSEKTIRKVCEKIIKTMMDNHLDYEIILVDDYSEDNSYSIMNAIFNEHSHIICIKLSENYGQQNALLCGLQYGSGDYFITIDDDLQNNPEDIMILMETMKRGYDVVYGVPHSHRKVHKNYRSIGTSFKEGMFRLILGKPKDIKLTSFRLMNKSIVDEIKKETVSYVYLSASILQHTKNIANVTVGHHDRVYGKSNYNVRKLMKLFMNIVIYYSDIPIIKWCRKMKSQYDVEEVRQWNEL